MITTASDQQEQVIHAKDYLRVSLDRSGRARSLEEQHVDHQWTGWNSFTRVSGLLW